MTDEFDLSLNRTNCDEMSMIGELQASLEERRIIELYEMAETLIDGLLPLSEYMNADDILTLLSSYAEMPRSDYHKDILDENKKRLDAFFSSQNSFDKIIFAELLLELIDKRIKKISERDFLPSDLQSESFTYLKNPLADEAFDVFSQEFSDPRLRYARSLKEACAFASSGEVSYALLPLEESGGARIHSVEELIFSYDLKINAVSSVFGPDGGANMKYALVSKRFSIPKIGAEDDLYLEIRAEKSASLSDILFAAEYFGASLYRINTLSVGAEGDAESYHSIVFRSERNNFAGLLAYLTLFINSYVPVGIYKNLE